MLSSDKAAYNKNKHPAGIWYTEKITPKQNNKHYIENNEHFSSSLKALNKNSTKPSLSLTKQRNINLIKTFKGSTTTIKEKLPEQQPFKKN